MATHTGFKGNKQALPRKACVACGREMVWRKAWARNWAEVRHCSDACRRNRSAGANGGKNAGKTGGNSSGGAAA